MGNAIFKILIILATFVSFAFAPAFNADAAAKKIHSRADFTKEQQKKFYDQALKSCRKSFGSSLHFVKVDYRKFRYVCYHY